VIDKVHAAVQSECNIHRELPPLIKLMNQPRSQDPQLGALGDLSSTYRDNFSKELIIDYQSQPSEGFDFITPIVPIGEHLNQSGKVLCAGTTKITHHIPGFRGHIPANLRNERKLKHACGKQAHDVYNNLILSQRGMGCVLGYTGHVPVETFFPRTERMTSCDLRTSNGAAYGSTTKVLL
jgi:hypothetical protein